MFITLAGHVAAMAPGTISALPTRRPGAELDETMSAKLASDAVALAQSIATVRGRNADWPAEAVRDSSSLLAAEAVGRTLPIWWPPAWTICSNRSMAAR